MFKKQKKMFQEVRIRLSQRRRPKRLQTFAFSFEIVAMETAQRIQQPLNGVTWEWLQKKIPRSSVTEEAPPTSQSTVWRRHMKMSGAGLQAAL